MLEEIVWFRVSKRKPRESVLKIFLPHEMALAGRAQETWRSCVEEI